MCRDSRGVNSPRAVLLTEDLVLRQQIIVLQRSVPNDWRRSSKAWTERHFSITCENADNRAYYTDLHAANLSRSVPLTQARYMSRRGRMATL